jgi:hypothetical protein
MNVGAVGGGAPLPVGGGPGQVRPATNPATPAANPVAPPGDSVASFLSTGKIADLIAGIDQRRPIQNPEVIAELLRAVVAAAEGRDVVRALERARELVAMDPERADTLASEPELDSIRTELGQLLRELAAAARSDAEQKVTGAHQALASDGAKLPEADRADLQTILAVAVQLLDTGRHAGYVKAGDLAEVVMAQCGWTPLGVPVWVPVEVNSRGIRQRSWLPILALAWLALGIAGTLTLAAIAVGWPFAALAVCVWGIGLVALVRFYRRARQAAATHRAT